MHVALAWRDGKVCGRGAMTQFTPCRRDGKSQSNPLSELALRLKCYHPAFRPFYLPFVRPVTHLDR